MPRKNVRIAFKAVKNNFRSFDTLAENITAESKRVAEDIHQQIHDSIDQIKVTNTIMNKGTLKQFLKDHVKIKAEDLNGTEIYRVGIFTSNSVTFAIILSHEFGNSIDVKNSTMLTAMRAWSGSDPSNIHPLEKNTIEIKEKKFLRTVFLEQDNGKQLVNRLMFAIRR